MADPAPKNLRPTSSIPEPSIAALRRPTVAAWAVDALARDRPDAIESMLELAASLRDAQDDLDGPGLRELSSARRRLVMRLASEAVGLAEEADVRVSPAAREDVERTHQVLA